MTWTSLDTWIVAIGVCSAVACSLPGNFLVLRRMSMMGDAISHAVLPGLALAFLFTGTRAGPVMMIGAAIAGLLTAALTQAISRWGRVEESASMGVVFTLLFAVGLVLIVRAADSVDLDPGCVLYGAIELTPLDTVSLGGLAIPRALVTTGIALAINLTFTVVCFKELRITAFDPDLATTMGISASAVHYATMALVAVTAVACFETVGSILVIAMLIVPAATAHLLTERLSRMILISALVAAGSAILGHVAAITVPEWWGFSDTTTAGAMSVVAGLFFLFALLFAPRHGWVSKGLHLLALKRRIRQEDLLGALYREEEAAHSGSGLAFREPQQWSGRWAMFALRHSREVDRAGGRWRLTEKGRAAARNIIRSHRLWETYLVQDAGVRPDHVHGSSERLEHVTTPGMQAELDTRSGRPESDPHGHRIP